MKSALAKRSDLNGFQVKVTHKIDSENDKTRHLKRKNTPNYRLIDRYFKSPKQYWKERNRRKQVLKLTHEGLTLQQIAKELSVSYRTVRRDAVKLRPYIRGQFNKHMAMLCKAERERLDRELEGLSAHDMGKRFMMITNLMFKTRKLSKKEQYERHNKTIVIDLDNPTPDGYPRILLDKPNSPFKTPYTINLVASKDGKPHVLGGITIG